MGDDTAYNPLAQLCTSAHVRQNQLPFCSANKKKAFQGFIQEHDGVVKKWKCTLCKKISRDSYDARRHFTLTHYYDSIDIGGDERALRCNLAHSNADAAHLHCRHCLKLCKNVPSWFDACYILVMV